MAGQEPIREGGRHDFLLGVASDLAFQERNLDAEGIDPQPGINIWAEGLEYSTTPVPTDANGQAVITVNYPYGPSLDIVGQDPGETYRLFTEQVLKPEASMNR